MARLRRKAATSEHETKRPLVGKSHVGTGAQFSAGRLDHVSFVLTAENGYRYLIELDPEDCVRVRRWLVEQALGMEPRDGARGSRSEAQNLRELADVLERT